MADRPSGTVTFLFTDVEGSTRLLRALGPERYRSALEDHRRIVRQAVAAHGGQEVDTQGDAFFIAFHRVQDAVAAATDIQHELAAHPWPDRLDVRVRMGIHTTEALPADDGYVGVGVHTGARIAAAAHGGQVLLSQASAELAGEEHGIRLIDLGAHRLKDLSAPQRLHQLVIEGLPDRFPSPRTLVAGPPSNLPPQMTALVGRDREVREVVDLSRRDGVRLVTLTGAGGAGKTRLALAAAAELLDEFEDGVFFIPLESVSDAELVLPAIGQALSVSEAAGQSLSAFLGPKRMLLIIDNLEQVIGAASALAQLLREAPGVRAIVTSREALRVAAEQIYPVDPLAPSEAIALFAERAAAIQPGFAVTDANADAVGELCRRLEGLPLAVELAAARVSMLGPEAILARLDQRLTLLTGGSRDQPARLQTIRNTLQWSHDLLGDPERRLFADLSVFVGGFTLDAAEAVGDTDLDLLRSLVDKSLVQRRVDRFLMLETVREFAAEQLQASGDVEAVKGRHATFFEKLATRAHDVRLRRQAVADELEADHDNLRAALEWSSVADAARYARLAGQLGWFWHVHSHFAEGRARVEDALARTPPDGGEVRARLLSAAVELAAWHGDVVAAERFGADALAAWRALGRDDEAALALHDLGWGHFFAGGHLALGRRHMEDSLALHRSQGDPQLINRAQLGLLQLLVAVGDVATVKELGPEALDVAQRLGDRWSEHFAHHFLADCALIEGDAHEAERRYRLSLEAAWESGDQVETCYELQGMAMAAAAAGNPERALRLAAATSTAMGALGVQVLPQFWSDLIDRHVATARGAISEPDAETAWREGGRLALDAAVGEAMARPR